MLREILTMMWFLSPAAIANVVPVFLAKVPFLKQFDTPLDFHKKLAGRPIFGTHKTWRGLLGGIIAAILFVWLQVWILDNCSGLRDYVTINYTPPHFNPFLIGTLLAIGALGGDAIESFIKRRAGIAAGRPWHPFDQIDFVVGAALATCFVVPLTWLQYLAALVIGGGGSQIASWVGHKLGLKNTPD